MSTTGGGDPQQQQPQYVQVPTDMQQQQQQPLNTTTATAAASTSNYPAFDLGKFWNEQMHLADMFESDFKNHPLPLARIKKVMKTDQEVKVCSEYKSFSN
jgi:nuclear transcription factor Y gamma